MQQEGDGADSDDDAVAGEAMLRLHAAAASAAGQLLKHSEREQQLLSEVDRALPGS
jgi:predicted HAD superfamily Cof-like phosphohydrolase